MSGIIKFLRSSKGIATITGILSCILVNILGLDADKSKLITEAIIVIIGIFIGAQGYADGKSGGATSSTNAK